VSGPVALVGAGAFLPEMAAFDADLLATTGRRRPRVVIVPTATSADGEADHARWVAQGIEHFGALGAEVEAIAVLDRASADDESSAQAIGEADVVYLAGGEPGPMLEALTGSAVWAAIVDAHARGAVIAGCSGGAMALVDRVMALRGGLLPWPLRWRDGLAVVEGIAVLPGYDRMPEPLAALLALQAPRGTAVLGIDEGTAIVGRGGSWQVHGRARVTVWRGRKRERLHAGDVFRA
jgi:cyanophycinase-like exopeptidase